MIWLKDVRITRGIVYWFGCHCRKSKAWEKGNCLEDTEARTNRGCQTHQKNTITITTIIALEASQKRCQRNS